MSKIKMNNPIVEIDGDEMTRVLWQIIKEKLILPFIDLNTEYYDLGIKNRDQTEDRVTIEAANAIKRHRVGVKNATITPNDDRVKEYSLKKAWKSPNGTIRAILDGTVFRKPIIVKNIKPSVISWKKPIIIGRHAYGDIYKPAEIFSENGGKLEITVTDKNGNIKKETIIETDEKSIILGIHNTISSIESFARACFEYALDEKVDLWFSAKDTILKIYDQNFKNIFQKIYEEEYKEKFESNNLKYNYSLIDDAVAKIIKSEGGILWALKNYDGDVMSDMVASAFGSLAMMTSVLVSPNGYFEYEAAHGTVQRHYYKYLKGEKTSTNSTALIFAWSGALRKRGEIDNNRELIEFSNRLEKSVIHTIESGIMTGDLATLCEPPAKEVVNAFEFIDRISSNLIY
ncbi:MAG TPA: NADP-dependent isocitrate dehydrogenase [Spirochaetota bacterium]|nr:NADP-dependent isocitrate dehydrogenase [Spirochaetota bacterium]HOL57242.1 NADP-dependent isocitrate dehydrogenase [Spirochaetota bacterium]HPP03329.1 NADP-dependent isocitrate dehydrogenase [Spirochaetota bacterium]